MTRAAIKYSEEKLREAVLAGDAGELDRLLTDAVFFCSPAAQILRKDEDLEAYRSGALKISRYDTSDMTIELHGDRAAAVTLRLQLEGVNAAQPFAGAFRCVRMWVREDASHAGEAHHGHWRVACGSLQGCT
jgi:hypothetical protein